MSLRATNNWCSVAFVGWKNDLALAACQGLDDNQILC